jgi:peptidoglycan/LPS O-acetylase OafA/YrhL
MVGTILLFFGEISYSLYLVHQEVGYSLLHLGSTLGLPDDLSLSLVLMIVIAIARVINKFVERPAQRWIKNFYSARQEVVRVALAG